MKEEALALAKESRDPAHRLNVLREYLQVLALRSLHESEAFASVVFVGGTALRLLHGLPRFSEDLDFSVTAPGSYEPVAWLAKLKRDLSLAGFDCRITWNDRKTVHCAWVRIARVLQEAGLAALANQNLSIKLEVDTRPPAGGTVQRSVVTRRLSLVVCHHDLPSLMAGKVHAVLARPYPKGRDWYDLLWYRSQVPPIAPNLLLLQHALDQTEGAGTVSAADWLAAARRRLARLHAGRLADDVRPLLERPADGTLLTRENLDAVLRCS